MSNKTLSEIETQIECLSLSLRETRNALEKLGNNLWKMEIKITKYKEMTRSQKDEH